MRLLRALLMLVVLVIVVVVAGAYFLGIDVHQFFPIQNNNGAVGTSGRPAGPFDPAAARERGAEVGERLAEAGNKAQAFMSDAALTAKIKSKMALDDHVKSQTIRVTTNDHVVTLSGRVASQDQRRRALDLARDTEGVKSVIDHLQVR